MGINLEDIVGNKNNDVLVDKSKRQMNILLIAVAIVVILIVIVGVKIIDSNNKEQIMSKAAGITRDAEKISNAARDLYTRRAQGDPTAELIGTPQDNVTDDKIIKINVGNQPLEFRYGYYFLTREEVSQLITNAPLEFPSNYIVNYATGEAVNLEGVNYGGKTYYEVADLSAIARKSQDPNTVIPSDNTIFINSPDDMAYFAQYPYAIFRLNRSIDMGNYNNGNGWTPVANFSGKFDGRGYTIQNLRISNSSLNYAGLFGTVEAGAIINNLVLENVDVAGADFTGAVAGSCKGRISNCKVTGNVYSTGRYVGGIFGNFEGTATNVESSVKVRGSEFVGGFAGQITGGSIVQCKIKDNSYTDIRVSGTQDCVGGFVGLISANRGITMDQLAAVSTVSAGSEAGGFVGKINALDSNYAIKISNCYSQGIIEECTRNAGGFVGDLTTNGAARIELTCNYTTTKPTQKCETNRGGFVGKMASNNTSINYCYWERDSLVDSGLEDSGVGNSQDSSVRFDSLTSSAIRLQTNYTGWDSVLKLWRFDNVNPPVLSWE